MIPNHTQFIAAIQDKRKVYVRFYSQPDSGVLDRVCAPVDYGPGRIKDGLNRYWLWDYANDVGLRPLGLVPQQILDLQVLGEVFDPTEFILGTSPVPVAPPEEIPPATVGPSAGSTVPLS